MMEELASIVVRRSDENGPGRTKLMHSMRRLADNKC